MLVIRDEQIIRELEEIAEREQRPVEDVLKSLLDRYPTQLEGAAPIPNKSEALRRIRHKIYERARQYWKSAGDITKSEMSDKELDEQFGAFDEEGIPRLKDELASLEPPPGSPAYAAMIAERANFRSGDPNLARQSKEILREHFADDLLKRTREKDGER